MITLEGDASAGIETDISTQNAHRTKVKSSLSFHFTIDKNNTYLQNTDQIMRDQTTRETKSILPVL